jgi:hypothetical protein
MMTLLLQTIAKAGYYLPESSTWQGSRYYNENNVYAYVEYAVYDSEASNYYPVLDGQADRFPKPGTGRYIYAYQVLNLSSTLPPIATFKLLGGDPSAADYIGYVDDENGGLVPDNFGGSFIWEFTNGYFTANEHSAFMVFTTDSAPIAGEISISTEYGMEPPISPDAVTADAASIPEPATIALLSIGAFMYRKKFTK